VLRKIFGSERDEVSGDRRRSHDEGLHEFYSSPNFIGVIKSRRMGWAGQAAHLGERRDAYRDLVGNQRETDDLEDLGLGGKIILKLFKKEMGWGRGLD
jgi:hypothetical protein